MTAAPAPRRIPRALIPIVALALLVAACGGTATPSPAPSGGVGTPAASDVPSAEPTEPPTGEPTDEPTAEPTTASTDEPTAEPSEEPSPSGGTAAMCTGNDDNQSFYAGVADDVAWDVYCPVLPAGWFVESGRFRLAGGGQLEISYRGPGGRRIALRQGAYCEADADCPPGGTDGGPASYGARDARLLELPDGGWVVVAQDGQISWEAAGTGMDGQALAALTADFALVGE